MTGVLYGQIVIQLPKNGSIVNYSNYNYQKVELGDYASQNLGYALGINGQKKVIKTVHSLEHELLTFIQKPYKASDIPFLLLVNSISFKEQQTSATKATGRAAMEVEVYAYRNGVKQKVYTARASNTYEHTLNVVKVENYKGLLEQMVNSCLRNAETFISKENHRLEAFNTGSQVTVLPLKMVNSRDTVFYGSRPITWSDFKGSPQNGSKYAAAIFSSIGINTKLRVKGGKLTAEIEPKVFMLQSQSWAKSDANSAEALRHEQLHFDITMVVMEKLIVRLKSLQADDMEDLDSAIQYAYLVAYQELSKLQEDYDRESNHSLNKSAQLAWEKKVAAWLLSQ